MVAGLGLVVVPAVVVGLVMVEGLDLVVFLAVVLDLGSCVGRTEGL